MKTPQLFGLLLVFLVTAVSFAQTPKSGYYLDKNRKGSLFFNVGTEYRLTPLPQNGYIEDTASFFTNVDLIHSGPAISYGFEYFTSPNFSIELNHSLRIENILYPVYEIERDFGAELTKNALLHGLHFGGNKYFKISDKGFLFIRAGFSSFNGNSHFLLKRPVSFDENGQADFWFDTEETFWNVGTHFAVGYQSNRVRVVVGAYLSNGSRFYNGNFRIVTPYAKLTYTLGKM